MDRDPLQLKADADAAFDSGDMKTATQLYTKSLAGSSTEGYHKLTLEEKRDILANRSEAFVCRKKFRNAVRDCNEALSPVHLHTSQGCSDSRATTARFHLKRAISLNRLSRPRKAKEDYEMFREIWLSLGNSISGSDEAELREIEMNLLVSVVCELEDSGSEWEQREDLDSDAEASSVVEPMQQLDVEDDTDDDFPTQVVVSAPFINDPLSPRPIPFKGNIAVDERDPIYIYLQSLFQSAGYEHHGTTDLVREYMFRALEHQDPNRSKVFLVTRHRRVLEIPKETTLCDIVKGSRWPRNDSSPFKDWSKKSRRAKHGEMDGPVVENGGVVLSVIPNRYTNAWYGRVLLSPVLVFDFLCILSF
ncbi:hypothetical protein NLI96_g10732 [Meripilus lineatus]|uniref:Uncharacterized protein n=1 Tax=Meripilus lineatus TaxID=2056292 RepID=A0AAD5YDY7_9APHY|nr:hypothetical protein NLI96_g10732 [Physisporinus lineatus]